MPSMKVESSVWVLSLTSAESTSTGANYSPLSKHEWTWSAADCGGATKNRERSFWPHMCCLAEIFPDKHKKHTDYCCVSVGFASWHHHLLWTGNKTLSINPERQEGQWRKLIWLLEKTRSNIWTCGVKQSKLNQCHQLLNWWDYCCEIRWQEIWSLKMLKLTQLDIWDCFLSSCTAGSCLTQAESWKLLWTTSCFNNNL